MVGEMVGLGFRPYEEELVGYHLRRKIHGNEGCIKEIDIYSVDPWNLRFQSRDPVMYFFSPRGNKYANGNQQSRTTPSGFWKLTGKPANVVDRWGNVSGSRGQMLGQKRVLTFVNNSSISEKTKPKPKSDWVMHELHYTHTDLPEHLRTSYVVCRVEYKGDDVNIFSPNAIDLTPAFVPNSASSVVDQSFQVNSEHNNSTFPEHLFSGIFDMPLQGYSDNFTTLWDYPLPNQSSPFSDLLNVQPTQQVPPYSPPFGYDWDTQMLEQHSDSLERTRVREDPSHHCPKKPVTGYLSGDSSDIDADSMNGTDAWSSTDSVGSKDGPYHTPRDDTIEPLHNAEDKEQPKQLELQLQGKEMVINEQQSECERKMAEDSIKKAPPTSAVKQSWIILEEISQRNSRWIYLKNITGLLLFIIFIIGWIMLVG